MSLKTWTKLPGPTLVTTSKPDTVILSHPESEQLTHQLQSVVAMPLNEGSANAPPIGANLTGYTVLIDRDLQKVLEDNAIYLFSKVLVASLAIVSEEVQLQLVPFNWYKATTCWNMTRAGYHTPIQLTSHIATLTSSATNN